MHDLRRVTVFIIIILVYLCERGDGFVAVEELGVGGRRDPEADAARYNVFVVQGLDR